MVLFVISIIKFDEGTNIFVRYNEEFAKNQVRYNEGPLYFLKKHNFFTRTFLFFSIDYLPVSGISKIIATTVQW